MFQENEIFVNKTTERLWALCCFVAVGL